MKIKHSISILALLVFSFSTYAQSVDEIIQKHIEARGGLDNIRKMQTSYSEGNIDAGGFKIPVKMWQKHNKAMKLEIEFQGMKGFQCMTDTGGWNFMPFGGQTKPEPSTKEDVKQAKSSLDIQGQLVDYKEKGNKVEFIGKDDFEGTEVYKLQIIDKEGNITTDYIDVNSYLTIKTDSKRKIEDKEIVNTTTYSNYQKVNGVMLPFSMESAGMGGGLKIEKIELNNPIDDKLFSMPEK